MTHRSLKLSSTWALALVLMTLARALTHAQGTFTSSLTGTVVDTSGGVIPGADVKVKNNGTGAEFNTVTAGNGTFSIPALQPGSYSVTVSLMGFKTAVLSAVTVNAATPASVRITLGVGPLAETVVVQGESSAIVQTQSSAVATTMTANQILNLPLTSRNALDSLTSLPGFNQPAGTRDSTIDGLPKSAINITLDGMNIQDNYLKTTDGYFARLSPRLDAVEQVTVTTAASTADASGQGGAQIKFVTRSGTNELHGSVYHYYRNDGLNANTWFNNRDLPPDPKTGKAPRPNLLQNQPGARIGGPIVIPGLWDGHNKAFYFVNYEQLRQPSKLTRRRTILSPLAEQGIFRYRVSGQVRDVNLLALAANNGQTATLDPITSKVLADIRAVTKTTGSLRDLANPLLQEYTFQAPSQNINHYPTVRLDYNLSQAHRLMGSYNYNHIDSTPDTLNNRDPNFPGFPVTGSQQSTRWTTSESLRSTIGASTVNEFRVGATGGATMFSPELNPSMWKATSVADSGGYHLNINPACCGSGSSALTNAASGPTYQAREASTKVVEDTLTRVKGSHSLSFGTAFTQGDLWLKNQTLVPTIAFGLPTGDPALAMFNNTNFTGASTTDLANARGLYAILSGHVTAITADARLTPAGDRYVYLGEGTARARLREFDFFAQDSWRARSDLTINYGLRYALQLPFYPLNNSYSTATIDSFWGVSGVGNLFKPGVMTGQRPGFIQFRQGMHAYNVAKKNFAPSVGFAWTPNPKSGFLGRLMGGAEEDSVIRAGYSHAYERHGMSDFSNVFGQNPGLRITGVTDRSETLGNLGTLPVLLRNPSQLTPPTFNTTPVYPIIGAVTSSVSIFDANLQVPYSQTWQVGWQRKISRDAAVEVRYVGSRHLQDWVTNNYNEINIVENGFLDEFRKAQSNLQANIAAGRGASFRYFGPGTGTSPLPIILAYFSGVPAAQAGDPSKYTSGSFTDTTFVNTLAIYNPNPCCMTGTTNPSFAFNLFSNAARRRNALAAGLPANFFIANPDLQGGAFLTTNGGTTRYNALQIELHKRLSKGLQFGTNYSFGKAYQFNRYSLRKPPAEALQTGAVGGVTHALKGDWVYDLPFGRHRTFGGNVGPVLDAIIGGWSFTGVARIQSGEMLDFGNVRVVGMTKEEFQKSFNLRFAPNGQLFMLPQDIIDNTVKAFSVSATSPTGYSQLGPPTGRYLAPANGPDCIEVAPSYGDCGVRTLVVTGPRLVRFDLVAAKRVQLAGGATFEFRGEFLNAFNRPYFLPVTGFTTATINGPTTTLTSISPSLRQTPITNATTTSADNFRVTQLTGDNQSRIIQLVWRITW